MPTGLWFKSVDKRKGHSDAELSEQTKVSRDLLDDLDAPYVVMAYSMGVYDDEVWTTPEAAAAARVLQECRHQEANRLIENYISSISSRETR